MNFPLCDHAQVRAEAARLIEMGLSVATVIPSELETLNDQGRRVFTGKNPSCWRPDGTPQIISHSQPPAAHQVLDHIDTAEQLAKPIGLAVLPGNACTVIDFDPKDYPGGADECRADVNRLISEHPELRSTRMERTPSGGAHIYLRVADWSDFTKPDGKRYGQFTTTPGASLRGELLAGTRVSVTAPTHIKTSDRDGAYVLKGEPYNLIEVPSLSSIGIYPVGQKAKKPSADTAAPSPQKAAPTPRSIEGPTLKALLGKQAQGLLDGKRAYGQDRSANLTGFAQEVYGCENWLKAKHLPFQGTADALISLAIDVLGIADKAERVLETIERSTCNWLQGDEKKAQRRYEEALKGGQQSTYSELLVTMLAATIAGDDDQLMELRAEAISRFRRTDAQIEAALFKLHAQQEVGTKTTSEPESLDLSRISGMDWLIEGFIPDNDQTMVWGNGGSGKTTAGLAAECAVLRGTGLLDHSQPAPRGGVLFIASDSGAPPLYAAMQDLGMAEMPEVQDGPQKRLHVWASDPDQGMTAWAADLRGCIRLLKFVKQHGIRLVLIDSCKAVCSGAGLDYTNNQLVTALLTYFKEVICPHTAVVWLNHDGVAKGAHAGAKAWKEIPSMVHSIIREENKDGSLVNNRRLWRVVKSRMGPTREFYYELNQGELKLCPNQEKVGNCLARVVDVLMGAWQLEGQESLSRSDLYERICMAGGPSRKTLDNTLSTATRAKHPEVCRAGRGRYKLAPRTADSLKGCILNGKEQGQKPVIERDLSSSRQVPTGTSEEPENFPVGNNGKSPDCSASKRSGQIPSRNACTPYQEVVIPGSELAELVRSPSVAGSGADAFADEDDPAWGPRPEAA